MSIQTTKRQIAELLPDQGVWDEEAYLWLSERTKRLVELADGRIEMLPTPSERHQDISAALFDLLRATVPLGKVYYAPLRLRLASDLIREPDLLMVLNRDDPRRENRYWHGAALLDAD